MAEEDALKHACDAMNRSGHVCGYFSGVSLQWRVLFVPFHSINSIRTDSQESHNRAMNKGLLGLGLVAYGDSDSEGSDTEAAPNVKANVQELGTFHLQEHS